jgi:hypothetical protein
LTRIVQLVDVNDANIFVLVGESLDSIGSGDIDTYAMEKASLLRIPKSGAAATRLGGPAAVWAATTFAGTAYWMESARPQ